MLHLGTRAFKEIGGEVVQTCAFVIERENSNAVPCSYYDLQGYDNSDKKENAFLVGDAPSYNGLKILILNFCRQQAFVIGLQMIFYLYFPNILVSALKQLTKV